LEPNDNGTVQASNLISVGNQTKDTAFLPESVPAEEAGDQPECSVSLSAPTPGHLPAGDKV
jgi:hypothetical protein